MESSIELAIATLHIYYDRKRKKKRVTKGYSSILEEMFEGDDMEEVRNSTLIVNSSSHTDRLVSRRGVVCESGEWDRMIIREILRQLRLRQFIKDDYL